MLVRVVVGGGAGFFFGFPGCFGYLGVGSGFRVVAGAGRTGFVGGGFRVAVAARRDRVDARGARWAGRLRHPGPAGQGGRRARGGRVGLPGHRLHEHL
jgi:hypothetical protein